MNQSNDEMIWRYVDLPKFISLLGGTLWFARTDTFEDNWEAYSQARPYTAPERRDAAHDVYAWHVQEHAKWRRRMRKSVFVNCWTLAKLESIPMWKIYASYDAGIAVQSTVERFSRCVQVSDFLAHKLGSVEYYGTLPEPDFDYSKEVNFSWPKACELHFRKRSCFAFEQEWRAVIVGKEGDRGRGIAVPINVDEFIEQVVVSPGARGSFVGAVDSVLKQFGLKAKLRRSDLAKRKPREPAPIRKNRRR